VQHCLAVFTAFALLDPQLHALGVDIADLERDHLGDAQPGAIGGGECRLVLRPRRRLEQQRDLLDTQHGRQPARFAHDCEPPRKVGRSSVTVKKKRKAATALLMLGGRTPVCAWWCWKRRKSSAVAESGDRPTKAANARTLRM